MVNNNAINGSTVYNKVLSLVDYCGDIARNIKTGVTAEYNPIFSPNNIRRLILSPDGAMVYYHVGVGLGLRKIEYLNPKMVEYVQNLEDYTPMTAVLYADRVCSSIEEVIILTRSSNGSTSLTYRELDFQSLLKNYKGNGADLEDMIKSRYKRLYAYVVADMTLEDFMNSLKTVKDSSYTQLAKQDFLADATIHVFNENWSEHWGSAATYYLLDRESSKLNLHFKEVKETLANARKKKNVDEFLEKNLSEVKKDFDTAISFYYKVYSAYEKVYFAYDRLASVIGTSEVKYYIGDKVLVLPNLDWYKNKSSQLSVESLNKHNIVLERKVSEATELSIAKDCIALVKTRTKHIYESLANEYISCLYSIYVSYNDMFRFMVRDGGLSFIATKHLTNSEIQSRLSEMCQCMDITEKKVFLSESFANLCFYMCKFFVVKTDVKIGDVPASNIFFNKDYWMEGLKYAE